MNAKIDFESLGFTQEELQDRLVSELVERLLYERDRGESDLSAKVKSLVVDKVDQAVSTIADEHIGKQMQEYVENAVFQRSNKWGEPQGEELTFREYLDETATTYLTEHVSYDGKAKHQSGGFSWSAHQSRIAHLIHEHLHYDIERALKKAVGNVNAQIAEGLQETVKIKLAEITEKLKVDVKTGR